MRNFSTNLQNHSIVTYYEVDGEYYKIPEYTDVIDVCRKLVYLFEETPQDSFNNKFQIVYDCIFDRFKAGLSYDNLNDEEIENIFRILDENMFDFSSSENEALIRLIAFFVQLDDWYTYVPNKYASIPPNFIGGYVQVVEVNDISFFYANLNTGRALAVNFTKI